MDDNKIFFGDYWTKFRFCREGDTFTWNGAPCVRVPLVYSKEGEPFNAVNYRRGEFAFIKDDDDVYIPSFLFDT